MLEYIAKINTVVTPANNTVIYLKNTLSRWIFTCQFLAFFTTYFIYNICYAFFQKKDFFHCLNIYFIFIFIFIHCTLHFARTINSSLCLYSPSKNQIWVWLIYINYLFFNSLLNIDIDKLYDMYVFFVFFLNLFYLFLKDACNVYIIITTLDNS